MSAAATAHPTRAARILYGAGFSYMITLGATQVLVPLYALHLGYDLGRLGVLVASQAVFGLVLRVSGGAMADRFGERWVLWFSFLTMVAGSVVFALTDQFWVLIAGQTFMGFSRAAYWTSTQSYASRIDPARAPVFLGRINSSGTAGNVFGTFGAGLLVLALGYPFAFGACAAIATAGLLGAVGLPHLPGRTVPRTVRQAVASIPVIARHRPMSFAAATAFVASSSMAAGVVLFIPYFEHLGYDEGVNGGLRAVSMAAGILSGIFFGQLMDRLGERGVYYVGLAGMAAILAITPLLGPALVLLGVLMAFQGFTHHLMGTAYTVTAARYSAAEQRGMAMGYVGLYWGIAQLFVPAGMGALAAGVGLEVAFWITAVIFATLATALAPVYLRLVTRGLRGRDVPVPAGGRRD